MVKNLPAVQKAWVQPLGSEDPLEEEMATHSSLPGKSYGQRRLMGSTPWGHKELDTTKRLSPSLSFKAGKTSGVHSQTTDNRYACRSSAHMHPY